MGRLLDFRSLPPAVNALCFIVAAAAVWWAGVRLTAYARTISERLGGRPAFVGLLLLGGIASLPETETTLSASLLNVAGPFSLFAILLGIALTAVYLAGLIERRNYAIFRMGVDSLLVLVLYIAGLLVLFQLR
jgi:cation:H+ antiporter